MIEPLSIDDLDVADRRVLVRADLNVPIEDGEVGDIFRLEAALPTIELLRAREATVVVCSHLGRPKGQDPAFSLGPVAARLAEVGGFDVEFVGELVGPRARSAVDSAGDAVVVLENTRFEPGETKNDPALADALAELCDLFVLDAFGSAHRAHASTVGVAERRRSAASPLVHAEIDAFSRLLEDPPRPYVVALGGAKVADKLGVLRALLPKVDAVLVGGGMCFTLLHAEGYPIGESLLDEGSIEAVRAVLRGPGGGKIILPLDIVAARRFAADAEHRVVEAHRFPDDWVGLDIGQQTVSRFADVLNNAHSVFWNGPMGVFEWPEFRAGTDKVARAVVAAPAFSVVGGGDSVAALRMLGLESAVSHLSTGGGAGLELLEEGTLPGLEALARWVDA